MVLDSSRSPMLLLLLGVPLGVGVIVAPFLTFVLVVAAGLLVVTPRHLAAIAGVGLLLLPSGQVVSSARIHFVGTYVTVPLVVLGAATAAAVAMRPDRAGRLLRSNPARVAGAVLVAGTLPVLLAQARPESVANVLTIAALLAAAGATIAWFASLRGAVLPGVVAAAGALLSVMALLETLQRKAFLSDFFERYATPFTPRGPGFRPVATIGNPLVLSAALVMLIALLLTYDVEWRRLRLAALGVMSAGVVSTASRGSILSLIVVLIASPLLQPRGATRRWRRWRRASIAVAACAAVLVVIAALPRVESRGGITGLPGDRGRTENLTRAHGVFLDHPFVGVGFGGYRQGVLEESPEVASTLAVPDNMYVSLLAEVGAVGALLVIGVVTRVGRRVTAADRRKLLPLLAFAVLSLFFDTLYHDVMLVLLAASVTTRPPNAAAVLAPPEGDHRLNAVDSL
jgi:hypothetical protein